MRENRSGIASGAKTALDQGAAAVESSFFLDQSAHFRFAPAHRLRKRAMSEQMGMLEPGDGDLHDRWGPLHSRLRILRSDYRETIRT